MLQIKIRMGYNKRSQRSILEQATIHRSSIKENEKVLKRATLKKNRLCRSDYGWLKKA